jgi:hypothetical protein
MRALSLAMLLLATGAAAQNITAAHMEGCLVWNRDGLVSARNECSRPLTMMFMAFDDGQVVTTELAPGARFTSAAVWGESKGFIFTACPVGLRPSVRFGPENKETIAESLYNCVATRPTS